MIRRPSDAWPKPLLDEYRRLAALPGLPVEMSLPNGRDSTAFICRPTTNLIFPHAYRSGQDYAGLLASVRWLAEGPKIADISEEHFQALSRVELRLELKDFSAPYPTVLVNMPPGKMHQYVISHLRDDPSVGRLMIAVSCSETHEHDVVTVIRQHDGRSIEKSVSHYTSEVTQEEGDATKSCLRVALNLLLAMTSYGSHAAYLFPREVEDERKYVAKGDRAGRDGRKASQRLAEAPVLLTLDRTVKLHRTEGRTSEADEPTGREMPFHWRRGHWHTVACGKGRAKRKLVLYPPVMVRADLLTVGPDDTTTTYR